MKKKYPVIIFLFLLVFSSSINAENIEFVGSYDGLSAAWDVVVEPPYAYVCEYDNTSGLVIIDISNQIEPTYVGSYSTPGQTHDIAISGHCAFLADDMYGLQVVDISDPYDPIYASEHDTPGRAFGVFASDGYVFLASGSAGLYIFDVSDPSAPVHIGTYNTPYTASGVYVEGNYAYVTDHDYTLHIIDISEPSNPILLSSLDTPGYARRGIVVQSPIAFIPDWSAGLQIINVTNPSNPFLISNYNTPGNALNVYVKDYAYVTDFEAGIQVLDISSIYNPVLYGSYNTPGTARGIDVVGEYIYVADVSSLQILRLGTTKIDDESANLPNVFSIYQNYPNPFNSSTNISYSLPVDTDVTLNVYDLLGRKLETLVCENQRAGFHNVSWESGDNPSGVYFYKIKAGKSTLSKEMVLLK